MKLSALTKLYRKFVSIDVNNIVILKIDRLISLRYIGIANQIVAHSLIPGWSISWILEKCIRIHNNFKLNNHTY